MRKLSLLSTLLTLAMFCGSISYAQDFSNKGKDFWVGYGYHQVMTAGNSQQMVLYFAADQNANVTVSIPGVGYTQNYFVPANTVVTSQPIPKAGAQDVRLTTESTVPENKGIHITSDKPIVAYSHIYNSSVSGASILFPTNTLGKDYYSVNFTNISNSPNSNCWFYVVATDPGTTTVEITPSQATLNHSANVPFLVNLSQGQVYNVMGTYSGSSGVDLTGSKIQSINNGSGCKKIAVFSGSGRISITCNGASSSSDNYMCQAFPKTAWGKTYLTVPSGGNNSNNIYRICVQDPTTSIKVDGNGVGVPLQGNFYYELPSSSAPHKIEADKPIMVAQYFPSQGACGNTGGAGDPEVIYLSPVEQNINRVLWNATPNFAINAHYYNVIIPNTGTALTSFTLDGNPIPPASFIVHPQDSRYSYLVMGVSSGQHIIKSDSGFNAIAYGFGQAESYGYNAGTNIKDIYQFVSVSNPQATVNIPATCKDEEFYFTFTFPYQPTSILWQFNGVFPDFNMPDPSVYFTGNIVVGAKTLYQYKIPNPYTISTPGTYPIHIVAGNPTPDGCGNTQEIDFDLQVFDKPTSDFSFVTDGCVTNPVLFNSNAEQNGRPFIAHYWNFGDPPSGAANISALQNPTHTFSSANTYTVKYTVTTDIGCISDTVSKVVTLTNPPVADFTSAGPYCEGNTITFNDNSTAGVNSWKWDFGDASPVQSTTSPSITHTYLTPGNYNVKLIVSSGSCESAPKIIPVTIYANPTSDFTFPGSVCLPSGSTQFTDNSSPGGGSTLSNWLWDFGDASPTSTLQNPLHVYTGTGPYNITLQVTNNHGCINSRVHSLALNPEPVAAFNPIPVVCIGSVVGFSDNSSVPGGGAITGWLWNFGDGSPTSNQQNPTHSYAAAGTYTVTLSVTSAAGCQTVNNIASHTITVNALPTATIAGNATVCLNAPSPQITFTGANGSGPYTFTYTINNGAPTTISTIGNSNTIQLNVPTNVAGTFRYDILSVQEGSTAGCLQAQNGFVTVVVKALPTANATGSVVVCQNAPQPSITFTGSGGSAPYIFTYNINSGSPITINSPTSSISIPVSTATPGIYTYNLVKVQEGSATSCAQDISSTATVEVKALPTATLTVTAASEACLNATTAPSVTFTGAGGSPQYTFTYSVNGGPAQSISTTSGNSVVLPVSTATATSYTYTLLNVQEGSAQTCAQNQGGSSVITINPLPTADFVFSAPSCETRTISFNDNSAPNAGLLNSWTWDFDDPASGGNNSSSLANPTHDFATSRVYDVKLTVVTDKGCVSVVKTKQVTINARPKADFTTPIACTSDNAAPFSSAPSTIASGSIVGWKWDFGDANANAGNPNTSTLANPTHWFTVMGNYTVTLIVTSNNGCTDTTQKTFFVNGSVVNADFTVNNATTLCSNKDVSILDISSVQGNMTKLEIYWDYQNDPTNKTTILNPTLGNTYTHTYPEFGTPASKVYRIRYVAYTGSNCVKFATKDITLLATPDIQFNAMSDVCSNVPAFQITQASVLNNPPGGVFSGTGVSGTGLFTPTAAGAGPHVIRYTYTDANGCTNYKEQTIVVNQTPGANAGPDKVVLQGGQVALTPAQNASMPVTYLWTPPTGLNNPTSAFPIASPNDDITYTLTVTSDKGCSASDEVFVKVLKAPAIPNIFSPNGDGVHDKWVISYLESYPGCTVDIYNRYGQLIYHSVGYTNPWDGTVNGKPVPVGTYYYIVNPKNGRSQMSGYVDVIR